MEKLNIAEILRSCPRGMELDCTMYEDVYFDYVDKLNIIHCYIQRETHNTSITFNQHGTPDSDIKSKCVIYPKGKTTWEGFQRPFKEGDILFAKSAYSWIFIYKESENKEDLYKYVGIANHPNHSYIVYEDSPLCCKKDVTKIRFATEEEKQKLFDAIKANGYKWNAETKTLEKLIVPKFKVGDRIRHKKTPNKNDIYEISNVYNDSYGLVGHTWLFYKEYEDQYELVPNKFDISTLKPFDKVLVRYGNLSEWNTGIFSHTVKSDNKLYFIVNTQYWEQCIPYEGNEHLSGKTDDCVEYYKTWK